MIKITIRQTKKLNGYDEERSFKFYPALDEEFYNFIMEFKK